MQGAFVSTRSETNYGAFIFVFNRSIERLAPLAHHPKFTDPQDANGLFTRIGTYWAGFSQPIPVTKDTLIKVMIGIPDNEEFQRLQISIKASGWEGMVVEPFAPCSSGAIVPREWPKRCG